MRGRGRGRVEGGKEEEEGGRARERESLLFRLCCGGVVFTVRLVLLGVCAIQFNSRLYIVAD